MPKLLIEIESGKCPRLDMVFIDGMHLFDYTLLDFFYADKMLNINGLIIIDDIRHAPVQKLIQYVKKNYYRCYRFIETPCSETMATFVKVQHEVIDSNGNRKWNSHVDF